MCFEADQNGLWANTKTFGNLFRSMQLSIHSNNFINIRFLSCLAFIHFYAMAFQNAGYGVTMTPELFRKIVGGFSRAVLCNYDFFFSGT